MFHLSLEVCAKLLHEEILILECQKSRVLITPADSYNIHKLNLAGHDSTNEVGILFAEK